MGGKVGKGEEERDLLVLRGRHPSLLYLYRMNLLFGNWLLFLVYQTPERMGMREKSKEKSTRKSAIKITNSHDLHVQG